MWSLSSCLSSSLRGEEDGVQSEFVMYCELGLSGKFGLVEEGGIKSEPSAFFGRPILMAEINVKSKYCKFLKFQTLSNEILVIRAGILKMSIRIANREEPDQTASSEAV